MLSIDNIIIELKEQFNQKGNINFHFLKYQQQYYDAGLKDKDGIDYVVGIIYEQPMPIITNYYQTRVRNFDIGVRFNMSIHDEVMRMVNEVKQFKVDEITYTLGELIVDNVELVDDGETKTQVANGSLRLIVDVPIFITGADVGYKIDGVDVEVIGGNDIFDKALLATVDFGNNYSDINTGSELTFTFAVGGNNKVNEIFTHVMNNSFNKTFTFEIDYIVAKMTADLVLRSGNIVRTNNTQALMFTATFERALERFPIKINGHRIQAIGFTSQMVNELLVRKVEPFNKAKMGVGTNTYSFFLSNDKSEIVNDIIIESRDKLGTKFVVEYDINGIEFSKTCELFNLIVSSSENTNAVLNITLMESD